MAEIKQDLFGLQYSQNFEIQGMQEANVDLQLPPAPILLSTVSGTVSDGTDPIPDATVKLFDNTGMPYQHTMTDASGAFTLAEIPAGTYSLAAVKDGYRMSNMVGLTVTAGSSMQMDLVCTADTTLKLGAIAGILTVTGLGDVATPLGGAQITLKDSTNTVVAATYTAKDGEFAFYDLADGVYTLDSAAEGYQSVSSMTAAIVGGSLVNLTMAMAVDTRTYNGTVSGVIRDNAGQAVAGCFVGLYRVTGEQGNTKEELVATTKTNATGNYLFGGVIGGTYLVKAKLEK